MPLDDTWREAIRFLRAAGVSIDTIYICMDVTRAEIDEIDAALAAPQPAAGGGCRAD